MTRAPVISISHGGGPLPILGDPRHDEIVESLRTKVPAMLKLGTPEAPRAIVVLTAHWSERNPTISNARKHGLLYDYFGFPPEAYELKYDADGSPEIAEEVAEAMRSVGLAPQMNEDRGTRTLQAQMRQLNIPVAETDYRLGSRCLHSHAHHKSRCQCPHRPALRPGLRISVRPL